MDKVFDFPNKEKIEREAAEWLIRLDGDTQLSTDELSTLREWIQKSPLHRNELLSFREFWGDQSPVALPISLDELCYTRSDTQKKNKWFPSFSVPITALTLVALFSIFLTTNWLSNNTNSITEELYATAIGQQETIKMPDGTKIFMNTDSQIKVDYSEHKRHIFLLRGQAHFDVAKNPNRPFRVYAGKGMVQAIGTAFTVYYRENKDIDVTVSEGRVSVGVFESKIEDSKHLVENDNATAYPMNRSEKVDPKYYIAIPVSELAVLQAGQSTTILTAQNTQKEQEEQLSGIRNVDDEEMNVRESWRAGQLIFKGNSLDEVIAEISRYTPLSIEIIDPELKKIRIGGQFSTANTDDLFNALEANFNLKIKRLGVNRVEISSTQY